MPRPLIDIVEDVCGTHDCNMLRNRIYDAQAHTDLGRRGATEIRGITMRDLRDAFIRSAFMVTSNAVHYAQAALGEQATLTIGDLENLDMSDCSRMAWAQALTCEIERMMGIFPNLPESSPDYQPPMAGTIVVDYVVPYPDES